MPNCADELISVVIPAYNRAYTIKGAIESVLKQTYTYIEVIVVDDGSTDDTETVVKSIDDSRVIYYKLEKNSGACFARNYGAEKARGKYVAFEDSDDVWHPDKLAKQISFLKRNDADMVFCRYKQISDKGSKYIPIHSVEAHIDFFDELLYGNVVGTPTILLKKEVFNDTKFDTTLARFQDWDLVLTVSKKYKVAYLAESLVNAYLLNDGITLNAKSYEAFCAIYNKYIDYINKNPALYAHWQDIFGNCWRETDSGKAKVFYKESLKYHFKPKVAVKFLLSCLKIKI